jgi:predicted GH43/DUF377 family glycosyl hydrolase
LILILILFCRPANSQVIYVDDSAAGANDGTSWENAYVHLQDALTDANDLDKPVEIRVAQGIYRPDQGANQTAKDRTATFQLIDGVALRGGYAGIGALDPNARDIEHYQTILSGDLDLNDVDINDVWYLWDEPTRNENSYNVVTGSGTDRTAVVDGFSISGGSADEIGFLSVGGGMYNDAGSPTLNNCKFTANRAYETAGGMYNFCSNPILTNCTFKWNVGWYIGGGMYNRQSNPVLIDCTFSENDAAVDGGGMYNQISNPSLIRCRFIGNLSDYGSGMYNFNSNPTLTNCIFTENTTYWIAQAYFETPSGGGMYNEAKSNAILTNCTFNGNKTVFGGGGMYNYNSNAILTNCTFTGNTTKYDDAGGIYNHISNSSLINCILWDNFPEEMGESGGGSTIVEYSDIRGGWPGEGNIDKNPFFVDPGYWVHINDSNIVVEPNDPNALWIAGDYRLTPCSPCIDSGDPNYISEPNGTDSDGNPRVIGGRIDMGAYEYPFVYDKPGEGSHTGNWWKYSENPILTASETGQWDSSLKGSFAILKDNKEPVNQYKMWYVGGETQFFEGAGVGYATSPDGINWIRNENNPVLEPGEWWNASGFSGICVIKDGPIYKLWYEGVDSQSTARIGYATSSDGIDWDINNSNPVFSPGNNDAWDNEDVGNPCVVKEGSTYKMWYWGDNDLTGIDQIGLAVSNDGINWQRVRSQPVFAPDPSIWWQDGEGMGTPHVIRINSGYLMAYHAADQIGTIRIGLATSIDGLEWKKENEPILDLGTENSWDSISVVTGSLIQDASHLKLWYLGIDASGIIKVGLSISCDDVVFDIEVDN